ncbi:hypothetical protein P152DRAFT_480914 [Eremomyces bilateralis CBS 781.70]|uniref:Rhodopsin domain-containing protein n=1 Tax=Eremomyces bilateralis CBS 781.70 TaxID=1392243 RepID=A0A6G1G6M9_9PEZI|nr:uncharacterized protein P152DRAFT_480914 [Eremomyces bilateralis CBS 781.70]KAF1813684.1 hypothetical protein P152DRAFT_480914 [Eremomyces bilateralis CBS 781.70]
MSMPTVEDILTWPPPNYDNPQDPLNPFIYGVEGALLAVMTMFIAGRFISRTMLVKNALGVDDWVMLLAYIICAAMTSCHLYAPQIGIGRHLYDVPLTNLPAIGKLTLVTMALFGPACALTKISICLTYLRLFPSQTNKYINWGCIGIMIGWGISTCLVMVFQCIPMNSTWDVFTPMSEKNCVDTKIFFMITAGINSVTDCLIYLYPANYLWRVQMSRRQRISLISCFSLGVVVTIAGGCRIWVMGRFFSSWDQTYWGALICIVLAIEVNLGVVFSCLPALRPLMVRMFPRAWGTSLVKSNTNNYGQKSSTLVSSRGFRSIGNDPESIHIQKDVELTVSTKPYEGYSSKEDNREGSEEWVFRSDVVR